MLIRKVLYKVLLKDVLAPIRTLGIGSVGWKLRFLPFIYIERGFSGYRLELADPMAAKIGQREIIIPEVLARPIRRLIVFLEHEPAGLKEPEPKRVSYFEVDPDGNARHVDNRDNPKNLPTKK